MLAQLDSRLPANQEFVDNGMINSGHKHEVYVIASNDPLSATCDIRWTHELRRGAWAVRTETTAYLQCDERYYYLHASVVAFDGEDRVFDRSYNRSIARVK